MALPGWASPKTSRNSRSSCARNAPVISRERPSRSTGAPRRASIRRMYTVRMDPRVASAISHWAPRFVSNGVLLADFEEVTAALERWEDWCAAWSRRAALHEELGRESLKGGCKLTAGEHLARAAIYYHFAK